MADDRTSDLSWRAFQYIMDELSTAEAAAFDDQLSRDQQVREALAEMVLLIQALSAEGAALSPPTVTAAAAADQRRWRAPLAWIVCGSAACLALIAAGRLWSPEQAPAGRDVSQAWAENEAVALAWAEAAFSTDSEAGLSTTDALASFDEEGNFSNGDADLQLVVPSWMLEAVQDLHATQSSGAQPEES